MKLKTADRLNCIEEYFLAKTLRKGTGKDVINLAVGNPDIPPPPEVIKALMKSIEEKGSHLYQPSAGNEIYRRQAAQWYKKTFGVSLDYGKELISLIGSKEGIFHISLALLNKGDRVFAPDPGYPIYRHCAELTESKPIVYNLLESNGWQIDISELEEKCTGREKIIWLNSPHMPTGSLLTKRTLQNVVQFAKERNIIIVHDNPYSFILNREKPLSILSIKGAKDIAVELCSLSKTFNMPGFRLAAAAGNSALLEAVIKTKSIADSGSFLPLQMAAVKAFSLGNSWHKKLNVIYGKRQSEAVKLARLLACAVSENSSGMFIWAKLPGKQDDIEFCNELFNSAKILFTPGSIYGKNGKGHVRISLCAPVEKIKQAQELIIKQRGK